jgi:flagellar motility protein MotE (MotC chaperone)
MMSGVMKAGLAVPKRLALASALALIISPLLPGEAVCRPMRPAAPSWRIQPAPPRLPVKAKIPKTKKRKDARSGWAAVTEPLTTGAISAEAVPPLPHRKPPDAALPLSALLDTEVTHATAMPEEAATGLPPAEKDTDVAITGVTGEDERPRASTPSNGSPAEQYCRNIGDAAAEARYARQKKELEDTEKQVSKRVDELNAKIAEYRRWIARRDAFSRKADAAVVGIYAKMKPDAAAQQLAILDEELAAALLIKLKPRVASAVMNEMEARRAARLAAIIALSTRGPGKKPPAPPEKRTP